MNKPFWIAIASAVIVVLAHVGLFWWFICKGGKKATNETASLDKKEDGNH